MILWLQVSCHLILSLPNLSICLSGFSRDSGWSLHTPETARRRLASGIIHPKDAYLSIYLILGKKKGIRLFSVSSVEFTYLSYQSLVLEVERTSVDHAKIPT